MQQVGSEYLLIQGSSVSSKTIFSLKVTVLSISVFRYPEGSSLLSAYKRSYIVRKLTNRIRLTLSRTATTNTD